MKRAKGFVLFMTLITLVAMTLIAVGLVRAVNSTNELSISMGFLQSTMASTDRGTEDAVAWLQANPGLLNADAAANGYYARDVELIAATRTIDYTGAATPGDSSDDVNWDGGGSGPYAARVATSADGAGNQIAFIIHRLCDAYGSPGAAGVRCAKMSLSTAGGGSKGGGGYGDRAISSKSQVYYRITTRAKGPRNTASYTQSTIVLEY